MANKLEAGSLDQFIDIDRRSVVLDDYGQEVVTWTTIKRRLAAKVADPLPGDERFVASQLIGEQQLDFIVRWFGQGQRPGVTVQDRIVWPASELGTSPEPSPEDYEEFDVLGVSGFGQRDRQWMRIKARRRTEVQNAG